MCGRYASSRRPEDLVEEFEIPEHVDVRLPDGTGIEDLLSLVNAAIITPPHQDS